MPGHLTEKLIAAGGFLRVSIIIHFTHGQCNRYIEVGGYSNHFITIE